MKGKQCFTQNSFFLPQGCPLSNFKRVRLKMKVNYFYFYTKHDFVLRRGITFLLKFIKTWRKDFTSGADWVILFSLLSGPSGNRPNCPYGQSAPVSPFDFFKPTTQGRAKFYTRQNRQLPSAVSTLDNKTI